jgi:hypothetical protein
VRGCLDRFLTSGEEAHGGSAVVKLLSMSWPQLSEHPVVEEQREFELEGSSPPIVLSRYKGCLASNGRYALRAVDQQLYVWNLDTRQLTAIIQHEAGKELSCILAHPLHPTLFIGTVRCLLSPSALHPTPYTLHPAPCNLHPTL